MARAFNAFGDALLAELRASQPGKNLVVSPFSVATVLAAMLAGAGGRTATQIAHVLQVDIQDGTLHESVGLLLRALRCSDLRQATRVLGSLELDADPSFLSIARNDYDAPFERIDVRTPAAVIAELNAWVFERTAGRIDNLLEPDSITPDTRLALIAALYFKAAWRLPFDPATTHDAWFRRRDGVKVRASMMSRRARLRYAATPSAQVVDLEFSGPADGPSFAMLLALPTNRDATEIPLEGVVAALSPADWCERSGLSDVHVALPRFTLSSTFRLRDALEAVGITDMFSEVEADFTRITDVEPLHVDVFAHRAVVEVDEAGATAAAATFLGAAYLGGPPPDPITVEFNRPFSFVLREIRSNLVLFAGWVEDPAS